MIKDPEKSKAYRRAWYAANKQKCVDAIRDRERSLTEWMQEYKAGLKCQRCPEDHPACLHFHHRDGESKESDISYAIRHGWSKERILKEIAKCEVLCANCHAKHHYNERVSYSGPVCGLPKAETGVQISLPALHRHGGN